MVGLAAVEPDRFGVVDEDVVDGCVGLGACDGDEAGFEAGARGGDEGGVGDVRRACRGRRRWIRLLCGSGWVLVGMTVDAEEGNAVALPLGGIGIGRWSRRGLGRSWGST